eukprot:TRINITY_DN41979_c0_g1_i1.p1 TRINITY_DN41979_c0_g1~~TRINITY_DN41979_c0_g1_i1.p1  ORF type:complete len:189 (+),score=37.97 TRINITY_DN41979_c0_g1_i1:94-660(+)
MGSGMSKKAKSSTENVVSASNSAGPKITLSICLVSGEEIAKQEVLLACTISSLLELAEKSQKAAVSSLISPQGVTLKADDTIQEAGLQDGDVVTAILLTILPGKYQYSDRGYMTLGPDDEFHIHAESGFVHGTYINDGFSICAKGEFQSNGGPLKINPDWTSQFDLKTFLDNHPPVSDERPKLVRMLS